jgi:hypothetical protein
MVLQPAQTFATFPYPSTEMGFTDNILALSAFIGKNEAEDVPFAVICFLILTVLFVLVNLIMYVVQQVKYYRGKYFPDVTVSKGEELMDSVFNDVTLDNAKAALSFTPVVSLLILFILFRAENQNLDMDKDKKWKAIEIGIGIVTVGIILQAVDAFTVAVRSTIVSGIAESLGTLLTYIGYLFLLTGMFVVKSPVVPLSVAAECFLALALLLLISLIAVKMMQLKNRFFANVSMPSALGSINELVNEQKIEEIRSTASYTPVLMLLFFYLHFRYVKVGDPPSIAYTGMIGATVGVYVQTLAVLLKGVTERAAFWLRVCGVLVTYTFFGITMAAAIDAGWPAPSFAIEVVLILLFLMGFLKLLIVIIQVSYKFSLVSVYILVRFLFLFKRVLISFFFFFWACQAGSVGVSSKF